MKKINDKKAYLAPMVEVMNARVERGFQGSSSEFHGGTGLPPVNNDPSTIEDDLFD